MKAVDLIYAMNCVGSDLIEEAAEGAVAIFREDRRRAAALFRGQVRQLPDSHGVQAAAQEQAVAPSGAAPGPGCEDLRLQLADPVLLALQQLVHFGGSLPRLQELRGEGGADQLVLLMALRQEIQAPSAAEHLDAAAAAEPDAGEELDQADLAGALHMDAAAGAGIKAGHLDDPHGPGQGPLGPVGHIGPVLGAGGPDRQWALRSVPMSRLMEMTVRSGLVTAWRLATWPTKDLIDSLIGTQSLPLNL